MSTGRAHWEVLLRARAVENQCFVVASAQTGFHNERRESYGHAMIVGPFGEVLARCDPTKDVDVQTVRLDMRQLDAVRQRMPCLEHRRSDVYSLLPVEFRRSDDGERPQSDGAAFVFETFDIPADTIFF